MGYQDWDFLGQVANRALGTPEAEMQLSRQHQGSKTQDFKVIAIGAFQFLGERGEGKDWKEQSKLPVTEDSCLHTKLLQTL